MVPTTGNPRLLEFAMKECLTRQAELDILFIRHLAVTPMGPTAPPSLAEDADALALFERLRDQSTTTPASRSASSTGSPATSPRRSSTWP